MFSHLWVPPKCELPPPTPPTFAAWWTSLTAPHHSFAICLFLIFEFLLLLFVIYSSGLYKLRKELHALRRTHAARTEAALAEVASTQATLKALKRSSDKASVRYGELKQAHQLALNTLDAKTRRITTMTEHALNYYEQSQASYKKLHEEYTNLYRSYHSQRESAAIQIDALTATNGVLKRCNEAIQQKMGWTIDEPVPETTAPEEPMSAPIDLESALKTIASLNSRLEVHRELIRVQTLAIKILDERPDTVPEQPYVGPFSLESAFIKEATEAMFVADRRTLELEVALRKREQYIAYLQSQFIRPALPSDGEPSNGATSIGGSSSTATDEQPAPL
ncbi:hypothetical protein FA95DRAFT_1565807 [Auriscalpium vulgare]|uniref:Uncharacterized protein n=1 Tax=Auriscalpium vulgare TaxID=40419 RepID=A0ACB8RBV4_9AGAM|nr:hypothetical protein FA95DRAFT_1565807 [Auriscalpium vulgare]